MQEIGDRGKKKKTASMIMKWMSKNKKKKNDNLKKNNIKLANDQVNVFLIFSIY